MGDLFTEFGDALNPALADELKEIGMAKALEHANKTVSDWGEKAYKHFIDYCRMVEELKTEDARVYAEAQGFEMPPTKRAWGSIPLRAVKDGYILRKGVEKTANPKCHGGFATVWTVIKAKFNQA